MRGALTPHLGPRDWQQQALVRRELAPVPELARVGHGHLGVDLLQCHLPVEVWGYYYKFAFVRHPLDRFVSACFFLFRGDAAFAASPVSHMRAAMSRARFRERVLIRPQSELLVHANGDLGVDFVGRYERLEQDVALVGRQIGVSELTLGRVNTSDHDSYDGYYDEKLLALVEPFYAEDFERFGYS